MSNFATRPKFDPNAPFEVEGDGIAMTGGAPKFDPTQPFEEEGAQATSPELSPGQQTARIGVNTARTIMGAKKGVTDVLDAGAQMLVNALPESVVNGAQKIFGPQFAPNASQMNERIAASERKYLAERAALGGEGFDAPRLAGNVAGTAPLMAVAPGPGTTLLGTAVRGAGTGAVMGSLQPVVNTERPFWEQKGDQAKIGAISGGIAAPVTQIVGRVIAPQVDKSVKYLMDRGITPRPDQIIGPKAAKFADKAQSIPIVGDAIAGSQRRAVEDFNKAAYNEVLKSLGTKHTGPVGREGIAGIQQTLSQAYDDVIPKLQFKGDPTFVQEFKKIAQMAQNLPPDKLSQFQRVMTNELIPRFSKTGQMDGLTFKQMESELSKFASQYGSSSSADDRVLADAVREVLAVSRSALERANPAFAPQLKRINEAYAKFVRVQDAASRIGTEEGIFTPAQLLSAVRASDKSVRKGAFSRGDALLQTLAENGKKVLGSKYPDSGTAGRLANMGAGAALITAPGLTTVGATAGALPYTEFGQKLAAALLAKRPAWAEPIRPMLERVAIPVGGAVGLGFSQ